ncbi:MAG: hypothetical protein WD068_01305 [Candidatus Babeliales bacterium]
MFFRQLDTQDLVFGINPTLLKQGHSKLILNAFYTKDKDRLKVLLAAPRFRHGITDAWEFNLSVPLVEIKQAGLVTTGVGDIVATLKWQPYAYKNREDGSARLLALVAGFAFPGNLPAAQVTVINQQAGLLPLEVGSDKTSFLLGASTFLAGRPWGLLSSFLINIEQKNECGNRDGHFFVYSLGIGRVLTQTKFWNVFGLVELDWIYESSSIHHNKVVPCTSNHILWIGPNLIVHQASREFKFGIQAPLAKINVKRDYRLFLAFEWEF